MARAAIAFQAAYDYVDALSEQEKGAAANTARLHLSLVVALGREAGHPDYYEYSVHGDDGGYLRALVDRCRHDLASMPAFPVASAGLQRAASRIGTYQCFNHSRDASKDSAFAPWAIGEISVGLDLRWWEVAAAAGSSLTVFALMVIVARGEVSDKQVRAVEHAYFPWIGSLHTLLDSLIDRHEDIETEQESLLDHYKSDDEAVVRLEILAEQAVNQARSLCDGDYHVLILAAMASFYLSAITATDELAQLVRRRILASLGQRAALAMRLLRAKQIAGKLVSTFRSSAMAR